jgi:hypothetical protein
MIKLIYDYLFTGERGRRRRRHNQRIQTLKHGSLGCGVAQW